MFRFIYKIDPTRNLLHNCNQRLNGRIDTVTVKNKKESKMTPLCLFCFVLRIHLNLGINTDV